MTTEQMTGLTMNFDTRTDAFAANPVVGAVASIRAMQNDLTPRQQQIRDNGRRRVDALLATGVYGPVYP